MADDSFDSLRFSLMQDVLPVGLAMVERARKGGASKVVEAFTHSKDPLNELRSEGEAAAKSVRDRLDQVSPGLGNPVMSVDVSVEQDEVFVDRDISDEESLQKVLQRIEARLSLLEDYLQDKNSSVRASLEVDK